jgi:hypothetical protein
MTASERRNPIQKLSLSFMNSNGVINHFQEKLVFYVVSFSVFVSSLASLYVWYVHTKLIHLQDRGLFGDSFGGLSALFNACSFVVLAIAIILQRKEMQDAAESAGRQLKQAYNQLATTQTFEKLRLLPLVKAEWFPSDESSEYHYELVVRNVGPGPAIIIKVDVPAEYEQAGSEEGRWTKFITERMDGNEHDSIIRRMDFDELSHANRALAPNERQRYVQIAFRFTEEGLPFLPLLRKAIPVVHFFSVTGDRSDSESQFDFLANGSSVMKPFEGTAAESDRAR